MQKVPRIAVLRALKLGDMLCCVPALRSLRELYPNAEITLVSLAWAQTFATRYSSYIDRFEVFPGAPGLPEVEPDLVAFERMIDRLRSQDFDLAIQLHGEGYITNDIALRFGARRTVGFHPPGITPVNQDDYLLYPWHGHEIQRNLALIGHLGARTLDARLEFPINQEDAQEAESYAQLADLKPGTYICLHPGASTVDKRWPIEHFAAVGDRLAERGYRVVVTGCAAENVLARELAARMRAPIVDAACDISFGGLAHVIAHARLVVSNDTGVAHLAVACSVSSVVVFFATDVERWAPIEARCHRTVANPNGVSVDAVLTEVDDLLNAQTADQPALACA